MMVTMNRQGFTLIEIIIVVAILGILAIGLVAALNPVEQINRARDTTTLNVAREFMSGANQFQTSKIYSPACADIACAAYLNSLSSTASVPLSTITTVNAAIADEGATDGPTSFTGHAGAADIYVSLTNVSAPKDAAFVFCWKPESKFLRSEADINNMYTTIYNDIGSVQSASACPASSSNTCYRCLRQ